ncbi:MAG: hypothetical protein V4691_09040 [Pseudomonadota bacterium]
MSVEKTKGASFNPALLPDSAVFLDAVSEEKKSKNSKKSDGKAEQKNSTQTEDTASENKDPSSLKTTIYVGSARRAWYEFSDEYDLKGQVDQLKAWFSRHPSDKNGIDSILKNAEEFKADDSRNPRLSKRERFVTPSLEASSIETRGLGIHPWAANFNQMRSDLLKKTKLTKTLVAVTGNAKGDKDAIPLDSTGAFYYAHENLIIGADPFNDLKEGDHKTFAALNVANFNEIKQAAVQFGQGIAFTDIIIETHCSDGILYFADKNGNLREFTIKNLRNFLEDLRSKGLIDKGTQLFIGGCEFVESKKSQYALQSVSDEFGLRIFANRALARTKYPSFSKAMVFYPDPSRSKKSK